VQGEPILAGGVPGCDDAAAHIVELAEGQARSGALVRAGSVGHSYSSTAGVGAALMAATISGGRPERTFSGMTSSSRKLAKPLPIRKVTTSSTRHSGAEAPAVSAMVPTPSSHSGVIAL